MEQSEQREKDDESGDPSKTDGNNPEGAASSINPEDVPGGGGIGSISFVSCATGGAETAATGAGTGAQKGASDQLDSLEEHQEKGKELKEKNKDDVCIVGYYLGTLRQGWPLSMRR